MQLNKVAFWRVEKNNGFAIDLQYSQTMSQADWVKLLAEVNKLADFVTRYINEANQTVLANALDWGANVDLPKYAHHARVIEQTLTAGDIKE